MRLSREQNYKPYSDGKMIIAVLCKCSIMELLPLPHDAAGDHGLLHPNVLDLFFRHRKVITVQDHHVGHLAGFDGALEGFLFLPG